MATAPLATGTALAPHPSLKAAIMPPHADAASLPLATGFLPLWLADSLAGATGGALECICGHPLDTIKVAKQTGQSQESVAGTARAIFHREGWRGFYKGVKAPLGGLVAINSVMFTTYASTMAAFRRWNKDNAPPTLWHHFWAGCASGAVTAFVECPLDLMKCQMQTRGLENQSFFGVARQVFRLNGLAGFSQGLTATLVRNVPGQGSHFVVYASTLQYGFGNVDGDDHQAAPWQCLVAGSLAGVALWASTYPADVVKTMIQCDAVVKGERHYRSTWHCTTALFQAKGLAGFFQGFFPCMLRSVPATAVCFLGYELASKVLLVATLPAPTPHPA